MAEIEMPSVTSAPKGTNNAKEHTQKTAVTKNNVIVKKKNPFKKMVDAAKTEDGKNIGSYLYEDAFLPGINNLLTSMSRAVLDSIGNFVNIGIAALTNQDPKPYNRQPTKGVSHVMYNNIYDNIQTVGKKRSSTMRASFDFDNLIYATLDDAQEVLYHMYNDLSDFGQVTVADYYEYSNAEAPFTARNFGWTNLDGVMPKPCADGYYLNLKRARQL